MYPPLRKKYICTHRNFCHHPPAKGFFPKTAVFRIRVITIFPVSVSRYNRILQNMRVLYNYNAKNLKCQGFTGIIRDFLRFFHHHFGFRQKNPSNSTDFTVFLHFSPDFSVSIFQPSKRPLLVNLMNKILLKKGMLIFVKGHK